MMKHHALSTANEIYIQGILMQFLALLVEDAGCTVSPAQNTSRILPIPADIPAAFLFPRHSVK
jgi:hypothetical protein